MCHTPPSIRDAGVVTEWLVCCSVGVQPQQALSRNAHAELSTGQDLAVRLNRYRSTSCC